MIEGHAKTLSNLILNRPHFCAIFFNRFARLGRCQFRRCTVLIRGAKEQNFIAARTLKARVQIGGKLTTYQVAKVFNPIDIGDRGSDKMPSHFESSCVGFHNP